MTFDTFTYAEGLKQSGIPDKHVRALTQELTKAFKSEDVATKQDVKDLESVTKIEIEMVRKEIEMAKAETIKWVVGLMVAQTGIVIAAIKLL